MSTYLRQSRSFGTLAGDGEGLDELVHRLGALETTVGADLVKLELVLSLECRRNIEAKIAHSLVRLILVGWVEQPFAGPNVCPSPRIGSVLILGQPSAHCSEAFLRRLVKVLVKELAACGLEPRLMTRKQAGGIDRAGEERLQSGVGCTGHGNEFDVLVGIEPHLRKCLAHDPGIAGRPASRR